MFVYFILCYGNKCISLCGFLISRTSLNLIEVHCYAYVNITVQVRTKKNLILCYRINFDGTNVLQICSATKQNELIALKRDL